MRGSAGRWPKGGPSGSLQSCGKKEKARAAKMGKTGGGRGSGAFHRQRQIRMQIVREKRRPKMCIKRGKSAANMSWQKPEFRVGNNERPGQEKLLPKDGVHATHV